MIRRNLVILTGRATAKPELKQVGSNSQVCTIRMVCNERVKQKDGTYKEKPMYVDAECWGARAAFASEHVDRGTVLSVIGKLEQDEWGEGKDRRSKHKVYVAFDLQVDKFDGKNNSSRSDDQSSQSDAAVSASASQESNDLPF